MTAYDAVRTRIAVDSPIDLSTITWVEAANLCFLSGGTCDAAKTKVSPHMDIDTYPLTTLAAPATAWTSTLGRTVTPTLTGTRDGDNPGGEVIVTAKTSAGLVYKAAYSVPSGGGAFSHALPDLTLTNGTPYWFDVTMRSAGLSSHVSGLNLTMDWTESSVAKSEDVPQTVSWAGPQGYFPVAYRGWAAAGYTATGGRATTAIAEADFRTTTASGDPFDNKDDACQSMFGGSCPTDTSVNDTGFGDYPPGSGAPPEFDTTKATDEHPQGLRLQCGRRPRHARAALAGPQGQDLRRRRRPDRLGPLRRGPADHRSRRRRRGYHAPRTCSARPARSSCSWRASARSVAASPPAGAAASSTTWT